MGQDITVQDRIELDRTFRIGQDRIGQDNRAGQSFCSKSSNMKQNASSICSDQDSTSLGKEASL